MNIIGTLDYAIKKTIDKGGHFNDEKYIKDALQQYVELDISKGFTSNYDARENIESLSKDDIDRELLKNVVKKRAYAESNGYNILINTNKRINDDLNVSELEVILIKYMKNSPIDITDYLVKKHPKIRSLLIESFVGSRYFRSDYGGDELDKQEMSKYYRTLLNRIDEYYNDLKLTQKGLIS